MNLVPTSVVREWGLQNLSAEEQTEMVGRIERLLYATVVTRALDLLSETAQVEFDRLLDEFNEGDAAIPGAVVQFLRVTLPAFNRIVLEERVRLKSDVVIPIPGVEIRDDFSSCVVSYSSEDKDFADRLVADLSACGVRCWLASRDAIAGRKLIEQIDEAIRGHDRLVLILSRTSMNSEWVKTEIGKVRKREKQEREAGHAGQILFPLALVTFDVLREWECFDADIGKDSAREIREYFVPDFSRWVHDEAYERAFSQLLEGLEQ